MNLYIINLKKATLFVAVLLMVTFSSCSDSSQKLVEVIEIDDNWLFTPSDSVNWLKADVPGCVHTDLLKNGKIEDPFYRLNEHKVQWVDKKDWIYKTDIKISKKRFAKDRIQLRFKGLDTHADVYLNDTLILSANNMFRSWTVEVKKYLHVGDNELRILFHSPIKIGLDKYDNYPHVVQSSANDLAEIGQVPGNKWVSPHLRKAGYHFGWDWGPRLVTSGIWEPIYLEAFDLAKINDLRIVQNSVSKSKVDISAEFEIDAVADEKVKLKMYVNDSLISSKPITIKKGVGVYKTDFEILNPKLWWTSGLGEANLYDIRGVVSTSKGQHQIEHKIGVRTVELVREKDSVGTSFYFKLNGVPVFMKGANYIPNDVFLDRVTPEKYEEVILRAVKSNNNMIRVWGGGIYEKDIFYDLCDKYGILVWQDFMFACNMYPGHPEYLENVRQEAIDNIKRLRNHPSIALWCGNNEILAAWTSWGWDKNTAKSDPKGNKAMWKAYQDIFLRVLPNAVEKYDPQRFYWSSSPQAGEYTKSNLTDGDEHYWSVWGGAAAEFSTYRTHIARFMSEYGFQAFPDFSTVKKYTEPKDWDIFSDVMKSHQRSYVGNKQIKIYMDRDYRTPKDFQSFLYVGQVLQAEGIRFAMESHRAAMPRNMGSLYWQLNDCWPVASWSSTDYFGKWKALQYFTKSAFNDILVVPQIVDNVLDVYVVSDKLASFDAKLDLVLYDFEGKELSEITKDVIVNANTSTKCISNSVKSVLKGFSKEGVVLKLMLSVNGEIVNENIIYFAKVKDLKLPKVSVEVVDIVKKDDGVYIKLNSDRLAKNVYISVDGYDGNFSDNFFDLLPGDSKLIRFESDVDLKGLKSNIVLRTIQDTY